MNKIQYVLTTLTAIILSLSSTINAGSVDRVIIVNGYFFKEMPSEIKNSPATADTRFFMLSTPNGTKAIGLSTSINLSEDAMKYAIPVNEVTEGDDLLRRFNEAVGNGDGRSISFGSDDVPPIKAGDEFPAFTATDINGKTWTSDDVKGKVMVLNLWFTGCGPCRAEMPELSEWKDEMPDVMFFSSTYETADVARQVLDKVKFNWIPLVNNTQFKDYIGSRGYPLTIVVDQNGKIAAVEYGTSPEQRERLKSTILSLI